MQRRASDDVANVYEKNGTRVRIPSLSHDASDGTGREGRGKRRRKKKKKEKERKGERDGIAFDFSSGFDVREYASRMDKLKK